MLKLLLKAIYISLITFLGVILAGLFFDWQLFALIIGFIVGLVCGILLVIFVEPAKLWEGFLSSW